MEVVLSAGICRAGLLGLAAGVATCCTGHGLKSTVKNTLFALIHGVEAIAIGHFFGSIAQFGSIIGMCIGAPVSLATAKEQSLHKALLSSLILGIIGAAAAKTCEMNSFVFIK